MYRDLHMKKFLLMFSSIVLFTGCAAVQETAKAVIADPGVHAAANVLVSAAATTAAISNPEIVAVVTAVSALIGAVAAYRKKPVVAK
jgi:uncharacterized lipoprotein YajG